MLIAEVGVVLVEVDVLAASQTIIRNNRRFGLGVLAADNKALPGRLAIGGRSAGHGQACGGHLGILKDPCTYAAYVYVALPHF